MKPFGLGSLFSFLSFSPLVLSFYAKTAMAAYEVFGVKNPSKSKLIELGVSTWPKWEGGPLKIPRSFKEEETMYLVEGKVKVTVEEKIGSFEIGGGDLVVFPKGMTITWEITEPLKKHSSWKKE